MVTPATAAAVFGQLDGAPLPVAAGELARAGVPVFPCAPAGKRPIPERGFHEASIDPSRVEAWWRARPAANIGIPTGAVSGLVVIDVDVHGVNGYAAYARSARAGLIPEPLAVVRTPTGGQHAYFPADPNQAQRSWQAGKVGIDCRGDGGYIIAPPSLLRLDGLRTPYRVEQLAAGAAWPIDAGRLRDFLDPRPAPRPAPRWASAARGCGAAGDVAGAAGHRPQPQTLLGLVPVVRAGCRSRMPWTRW